jgi:hypothetical protein
MRASEGRGCSLVSRDGNVTPVCVEVTQSATGPGRIAADHAALSEFEAMGAARDAHYPWDVEGVASLAEYARETVERLRRYGAAVDLLVLGADTYCSPDRLLARSKSPCPAEVPPCPFLVSPPTPAGRAESASATTPVLSGSRR